MVAQQVLVLFVVVRIRVGQHSLPSRGAWQQVLRLFHYRQQRKEIKHHNYESGLHRITSYCIKRLYDICLVWAPETAADTPVISPIRPFMAIFSSFWSL